MRHAHATHLLESNLASVSALQAEMGHVDPRTTLGYCHGEALGVADPTILGRRDSVISVDTTPKIRMIASGGLE
jgi:integrase